MHISIQAIVVATLVLGASPAAQKEEVAKDEIAKEATTAPHRASMEIDKDAPGEAKKLLANGNKLILDKKFKEAIPQINKALKIFPKYAGAYRALGVCYNALNKRQEAIDSFKMFLELAPQAQDAEYVREVLVSLEKK